MLLDVPQQTACRILNQQKNIVEALGPTVVGVRYVVAVVRRPKIQKQLHAVLVLGWRRAHERLQIIAVHRQHVIEGREIIGGDLTRALATDIDAMSGCGRLRAFVGRVSNMPRARAGRIGGHNVD